MASLARSLHNSRKFFLSAAAGAMAGSVVLTVLMVAVRWSGDLGRFWKIAVLVAAASLVLAGLAARLGRPISTRTVIELDVAATPPELPAASPLSMVSGQKRLTLRETVETLERAAADKRVAGLLVHVRLPAGGLASIQELRDAIGSFRSAGKFSVAFADSFGEAGSATGSYYLASACDEITLQPSGQVGFVGLGVETNFLRRALDKAGIAVEAEGRHEYKNAINRFVETGFNEPHRESQQRLIDSAFEQIVAGIAERRQLPPESVRALADAGPLLGAEALEAGLVDALGYRDEVVDRAKDRAGRGAELLYLARYKKRVRVRSRPGAPIVAVVTGAGAIQRTRSFNPISPATTIDADTFSLAIRKAVADKKVRAIVLRVSTPGGSAVASDTIWRETVRAREAGKPVVVSMGDVAASGGYYMAAAADRIVAQPGTITGSIGVLMARPVVRALKQRIGFDVCELNTSRHARLLSLNRPSTESEWERVRAHLDQLYADFISKVASGRGMTAEGVHEIARGRVWTGADAHERGLVDELGGLGTAVGVAKEAAGIAPGVKVRLKAFPKTTALSRLRSGADTGSSSDDVRSLVGLVGRLAGEAGLAPAPGALDAGFDLDHFRW